MKFTTIYKNGKPERFFILKEAKNEFAFLQPYFLSTTPEHKRHGRIVEMDCLFSGAVWQGRQTHGFGYGCSADVYGELVKIIKKLHKERLTEADLAELGKLNIADDTLEFSEAFLANLSRYNTEALEEQLNKERG